MNLTYHSHSTLDRCYQAVKIFYAPQALMINIQCISAYIKLLLQLCINTSLLNLLFLGVVDDFGCCTGLGGTGFLGVLILSCSVNNALLA